MDKENEELMKINNILKIKKYSLPKNKIKSNYIKFIINIKKYIYLIIFLNIIFIIFLFIFLYKKTNKKKDYTEPELNKNFQNKNFSLNTNFSNQTYMEELIFDNITTSYEKAFDFLTKAINGYLVSPNNFTSSSDNPLISAIIPVYNSKNYILRSIRSIQNQNLKNFEIILINDFSTDDTLSYIEELQKEDSRIKIIKNQKNMGTLYSRSIGALSAKGEYIFPLDNGDMFLDYDVFDTIYNVANKDNFDIVEFRAINVNGIYNLKGNNLLNIMFSNHKLNLVLFQPELGYFPFQPGNGTGEHSIVDNYLWNKCIKTKLYQKGLNLFGEERYKRYMTTHEDFIIVLLLFNIAESYKFIGKYGVLNTPNGGGGTNDPYKLFLFEMYLIDTLIDFTKDIPRNKKIIVQFTITLLGRNILKQVLEDIEHKKLFISLLERIYACKYILEEDKIFIKNKVSSLNISLDTL